MAERARVEIDSIAARGDGVARTDGLVVFVPRTAPGDIAEIEYTLHGRLARGHMLSLDQPSLSRVEPPCPHYVEDNCGGCQLQHLDYDAQLLAKSRLVADAMSRIGRRETAPPEIVPAPLQWRYRRKLTLALRRRPQGWVAGLHPYDAPGRVFPLADCPITDLRVVEIWREILVQAPLFPAVPSLRGAVRLLDSGASFVLEGGRKWPGAKRFFDSVPSLAALWWTPENSPRRLLHDRRDSAEPGASFAQVNPAMAGEVDEYLRGRVLSHEPATVVDAYAGAGDHGVALAASGVQVTAIEMDPEASAWAGSRLPAPSQVLTGRVEDLLAAQLPADVVILNPPRGGVDERVTGALTDQPPRAILYVSCNPATLARDVARLPGYRVAGLRCFDMFPQTAHVESVCELIPEES